VSLAQAGSLGRCEIRRLLGEQFAIAARVYAEMVVNFTMQSEMTEVDYEQSREAAAEARLRAYAAGLAFEEHVASHRCALLFTQSGPSPES
jgi:hypothetical protein